MKLNKVRAVVLGLFMAASLSACTAAGALKAVTSTLSPSAPSVTAQVGAENVKQHLGVNTKKDESVSIKDNTGTVKVNTQKKPQTISTDSVVAESITFNQTEFMPLVVAFLSGLLPMLGLYVFSMYRIRAGREHD